MPKSKISLALIFGGRSSEHEISLISAINVIKNLNRDKYQLTLISIDKSGNWNFHENEDTIFINTDNPKTIALQKEGAQSIGLIPGPKKVIFYNFDKKEFLPSIDIIFPILHGAYGEDGAIQGLFQMIDIPFVGAGLMASSMAMDKDVTKRILRDYKLPIVDYQIFYKWDFDENEVDVDSIIKKLGLPLFIKPANAGSSVGVFKVTEKSEIIQKIQMAFKYDSKVLLEKAIKGREIECAVLGNKKINSSPLGEIIPKHEFYSYEAKYLDENGALLVTPAENIPEKIVEKIQAMALEACRALNLEGMARVDFFLDSTGNIYINEVNTIPGFTKISMYPRLWSLAGTSYSELIDSLIQLGLERHEIEESI